MTESPEESVASDVTMVAEDHEATIEVLQAKIDKLKSLLIKAKVSINEYKHKADEVEERLEEEQRRTESLRSKLEQLESRPPPAPHEIASVVARVKVEGVVWLFVRKVSAVGEWFREEQIKLAALTLPEVVDVVNSSPSAVAGQLSLVVKQYEERMKRIQDSAARTEDTLRDSQKALKDLQQAYKDRETQIRSVGELLHLVAESKLLHEQLASVIEEDDLKPSELSSLQQAMIRFIQSPAKQNQETEAVKEHIVSLHKTLLDLARRLLHSRKEQQTQEAEWRSTCDALVSEREALQVSLDKTKSTLTSELESCRQQLSDLTDTHESTVLEMTSRIEKLTKEAQKAVNVPYLRHVIVQYLTTAELDVRSSQVQERLVHVIATILEFSKEDITLVSGHRAPKGVLSRWLGA